MNKSGINKPAIIIPCWDNYQWVWEYWEHYFQKYWCHDIDWPVYFCTEEIETNFPNTISLTIGKCDSMERVRRCVGHEALVEYKNIFLWQEDIASRKRVSKEIFEMALSYFERQESNAMRIQHPCPHTTYDVATCLVDNNSDYLFSFQPGIFNREYFLDVTKESMSLWDMELKGTKALYQDKYKDTVHLWEYSWYEELVRQGNWRHGRLAQAAKRGIKL